MFIRGLFITVECLDKYWNYVFIVFNYFYFDSKFWIRNRLGDKMRDRYNLNLLFGMFEDGVEYGEVFVYLFFFEIWYFVVKMLGMKKIIRN